MTDIAARCRIHAASVGPTTADVLREAADEIELLRDTLKRHAGDVKDAMQEVERLRAENEQLKIALSDGPRDDGTHVHRLDEREGDQ